MFDGRKKTKTESQLHNEEIVTHALIALRRGAAKALAEAIALDRPFHVWENSKIVNIGGRQKRKRTRRKLAEKVSETENR